MGKIAWYEEWGELSLKSLKEIYDSGLYIRFYKVSAGFLKTIPESKEYYIINKEKNLSYIMLISETNTEHFDIKGEIIPDVEYDDLKDIIKQNDNKIKIIKKRFEELSANRKQLMNFQKKLLKQLEFEQVRTGMENEEGFSYLQGYAPKKSSSEIKKTAEKNGWGYLIEEPQDENEVPTLIKRPKWLSFIKPVFNLIGTVPGYKEFDISLWFSIFFMLFVAMLIGDAGYGFLFKRSERKFYSPIVTGYGIISFLSFFILLE